MALAALIGIADPAIADQPPAYEIKMSAEMVGVIETVISKYPMPWEQSNPLLQEITRQVRDQDAARQTKPTISPDLPPTASPSADWSGD